MTIYEIDKEIVSLVDPETGELSDYDKFEELNMQRENKIENMALWFKNLTAESKAIKDEEKNLADRRKSLENKATSLKLYLSQILGGDKFSTSKVSIGFRKSKSVQVGEGFIEWAKENAPELLSFKEPEANKTAIKECLLEKEVPFACFAESNSIQIK